MTSQRRTLYASLTSAKPGDVIKSKPAEGETIEAHTNTVRQWAFRNKLPFRFIHEGSELWAVRRQDA